MSAMETIPPLCYAEDSEQWLLSAGLNGAPHACAGLEFYRELHAQLAEVIAEVAAKGTVELVTVQSAARKLPDGENLLSLIAHIYSIAIAPIQPVIDECRAELGQATALRAVFNGAGAIVQRIRSGNGAAKPDMLAESLRTIAAIVDPANGAAEQDDVSPISPNSPLQVEQPDYPRDSALEDFMEFARRYSESEDSLLIGSILPVVATVLGRSVWMDFYGHKFANLYSMLVTKPGFRKTTNIRLAEFVGKQILWEANFLKGHTSAEALFEQILEEPTRLLIEEEGNALVSYWTKSAPGILCSKMFLKLYDCATLHESFLRNKSEKTDCNKSIDKTYTSILVGTTFNTARFSGLEAKDGMRRRFRYYVSERLERTIYWPDQLDGDAVKNIAEGFRPLTELQGLMKLSREAAALWRELQDRNRCNLVNAEGFDEASEANSSALAEEGSNTLKLAMIFECCRWLKDSRRQWQEIQPDTLQIAANHASYNLAAARSLDTISHRAETRNEADVIIAKIRTYDSGKATAGWIPLTRTELTTHFAAHGDRRGSMTTERLYLKVLPDLVKRGVAKRSKKRKPETWLFRAED